MAAGLRPDPTFLHARREAVIIFLVWCVALVWSVGVCGWLGYGVSASSLPTVWGVPAWVFWGVAVPWVAADLFALWFCFRYMVDDDLSGRGRGDGSNPPGSEG